MNTKSWCFQDLPFKIDLYICPTHFKILFTCPGRTTEIKFTALFIRVALYRKWNKGHKADWITNCCSISFLFYGHLSLQCWSERSVCASATKWPLYYALFLFLSSYFFLSSFLLKSPRKSYHRVTKFCMGS